ncbi:MAG: glutamate--tRNA ligase [Myxococcota bacterium]
MAQDHVRVRIGPSPTGEPHVGTAYVALFNYAFARSHQNGAFVVRIEDTDQKRSSAHSEQAILSALNWLGLRWDEGPDVGGDHGPYRQSERKEIYQKHVQQLLDAGHAYWCSCTPERLTQLRQRQRLLGQPTGYDGRCRQRDAAEIEQDKQQGVPAVVRLKVPQEGVTQFTDLLRGPISIANTEIDDQVLLKSDGFPTYHLANVVDDALMKITHVLRGEEWISSTPKHVLLYECLGFTAPQFGHLPLLRNADKSKVSKRKNPVSLDYFRQAGYLPQALLNFLGLMAFSMPDGQEMFSLQEFVEQFGLSRISLGGPVFDLDKLLWLNGRYLRERLSTDQWVEYIQQQLFCPSYLTQIAPLVQERINRSDDFWQYADFFFAGDVTIDPSHYCIKGLEKKPTLKLYEQLLDLIATLPFQQEQELEQQLRDFCNKHQIRTRDLFMPIRLMVTGKKATPPLFATMLVLGKQRCLTRIRQAVQALRRHSY